MTQELTVPVWAVLAVLAAALLLLVVPLVAVLRARSRAGSELVAARRDNEALGRRVGELERRLEQARTPQPAAELLITGLPADDAASHSPTRTPAVPAPLFADLVVREAVVQAASLAHGVRRAMSPQVRHRIRHEMRLEVRRARKQRRADLREGRRAREAQERAAAARSATPVVPVVAEGSAG